jgi:hypothetical protein
VGGATVLGTKRRPPASAQGAKDDTQSRRFARVYKRNLVEDFDEIPLNGADEAGNIYLHCLVLLTVADRASEVGVENNSFVKSKLE